MSLNPIRDTLEDFFVKKVAEQEHKRAAAQGGVMTIGVIRTIAVSVFRESVRDKVLYNLVFFAVLLIAVSYLLSQLTAGQDMKVIKDLGLAAMSLFGLFIAVFIGIGLVSKEVEKRSIYALLAKPIRREEFVVGKYLGLVLTLFVNLAIMTVAYYAVLGGVAWIDGAWLLPALGSAGGRSGAVESHRDDFSAADDRDGRRAVLLHLLEPDAGCRPDRRPVRGRSLQCRPEEFRAGRRFEARRLCRAGALLLLPNLAPLDVKSDVVHGVHVPAMYLLLNAGTPCICGDPGVGSTFIFRRRDFK